MWEAVFCLLPSVVLLLSALLLRLTPVQSCLGPWVRRAAWRLWLWACWCLRLPLPPEGGRGGGGTGPQLVCKPTALARFLLQHCGSLARPSLAAWPWGDPNVQTLLGLAGPVEDDGGVRFAREHLQVKDGGVVALDWAVGLKGEPQRGAKREQGGAGGRVLGCHSSCPPVLILIPNSWGRVTPHLLRLCALALQQGFYPVLFHRRGHAGCPLVTPRFQEFGDPSDLIQAVTYLRHRHPCSALLAVSEGSGSGLLLSYLGECGSSSYLTAAACLSPVLRGQLWFDTPLPALYRWPLLLYRKLQLSRYSSALGAVMDVERLLRCSSLRDLEAAMFCRGRGAPRCEGAFPVAEWDAYWERNEPLRDADEVAVPVLCLRSWDDPLLPPPSTLPTSLFQDSPYFLLALTARGGHCGFALEGEGAPDGATCWSHRVVLEYFRVVAEFLKAEERRVKGVAGVGAGTGGSPGPRRRINTMMPRRRRATLLRRERPALRTLADSAGHGGRGEGCGSGEQQDVFTWHRETAESGGAGNQKGKL
ncbi:protein ABHD15 [Megalops cyprinoides]|uniref:protein ABHD15 n=1 Tax=Megalops cyprinoides TaxID=118141 RepID=UPI0018653D8A|nr:protein ABHD15 [Megalops cyprinoides]